MIDGLVSQCGERLTELWKRDEGGTGQYPPPSLHVSQDLLNAFIQRWTELPWTALTLIFVTCFWYRPCWIFTSWKTLKNLPNMLLYPFGVHYYILPQILCLLLVSKDYSLTQGLRLFICYWMWCTHFLIKVGHPWSLFPQRLPFPLGWWNWYKACGC